jgi:glycosyltransferase involved in cell wall biosynthesis
MKVEQKFPNIIYKGVKFKEELTKALNRSALCIIPSLVPEGFGRVSLEAQACGCPVVCNAIGGLPETLIEGETGYVVNHMTHKNLATTIIDLLLDTNRLQSMSIKAAEYAQKFPVKNAAHDFMKMLI